MKITDNQKKLNVSNKILKLLKSRIYSKFFRTGLCAFVTAMCFENKITFREYQMFHYKVLLDENERVNKYSPYYFEMGNKNKRIKYLENIVKKYENKKMKNIVKKYENKEIEIN